MSSPMVNKDTLYFYKSDTGKYFMGFCEFSTASTSKGWGRSYSSFKTEGFKFNQYRPYSGKPIGQRCILQWQNQ